MGNDLEILLGLDIADGDEQEIINRIKKLSKDGKLVLPVDLDDSSKKKIESFYKKINAQAKKNSASIAEIESRNIKNKEQKEAKINKEKLKGIEKISNILDKIDNERESSAERLNKKKIDLDKKRGLEAKKTMLGEIKAEEASKKSLYKRLADYKSSKAKEQLAEEKRITAEQKKQTEEAKRRYDQNRKDGLARKRDLKNQSAEIRSQNKSMYRKPISERLSDYKSTKRGSSSLLIARQSAIQGSGGYFGVLSLAGSVGGRMGMAGAAIGGMANVSLNSKSPDQIMRMNEGEIKAYNRNIAAARSRGTKWGAGFGIGANALTGLGSMAFRGGTALVGAQARFVTENIGGVAEYQKELRTLKNVVNADPYMNEKLSDSDIAKLGQDISEMAVKYGSGTISEYASIFRDIVGKGLSEGTAKAFLEEGSKLSNITGANLDTSTNLAYSLISGDADKYVEMGMITRDDQGKIEFNGKKGKDMFSGELGKINALAAAGGVEVEDLAKQIGNISSSASIGKIDMTEVMVLQEAISTIVPNAQEGEVAIRNFLMQTGKPEKKDKFIEDYLEGSNIREFRDLGKEMREKESLGELTSLDMFDAFMKMASNEEYQKSQGKNEKALFEELIGTQVRELRGLKGAYSFAKVQERYKHLKEVEGMSYEDLMLKEGSTMFDLDLSLMSGKNLWEMKKNQYGGVAAPFVSNMIMGITGGDTESYTTIKDKAYKFINETYADEYDDKGVLTKDNTQLRANLKDFSDQIQGMAEKFGNIADKFANENMGAKIANGVLTFNNAILGFAEGLSNSWLIKWLGEDNQERYYRKERDVMTGLSQSAYGFSKDFGANDNFASGVSNNIYRLTDKLRTEGYDLSKKSSIQEGYDKYFNIDSLLDDSLWKDSDVMNITERKSLADKMRRYPGLFYDIKSNLANSLDDHTIFSFGDEKKSIEMAEKLKNQKVALWKLDENKETYSELIKNKKAKPYAYGTVDDYKVGVYGPKGENAYFQSGEVVPITPESEKEMLKLFQALQALDESKTIESPAKKDVEKKENNKNNEEKEKSDKENTLKQEESAKITLEAAKINNETTKTFYSAVNNLVNAVENMPSGDKGEKRFSQISSPGDVISALSGALTDTINA